MAGGCNVQLCCLALDLLVYLVALLNRIMREVHLTEVGHTEFGERCCLDENNLENDPEWAEFLQRITPGDEGIAKDLRRIA